MLAVGGWLTSYEPPWLTSYEPPWLTSVQFLLVQFSKIDHLVSETPLLVSRGRS